MRLCVAVLLAGCGFSHGTPGTTSDAHADGNGSDGGDDAGLDGTPTVTCYDRWLDNTVELDTPVPLATVNSVAYDRDPWLPADELTLYFSSARIGSAGTTDVWMATRPSTTVPFGVPILATPFNSPDTESKLSMSADGLVAVVGSNRATSMGGSIDVWESVRTTTTEPWPEMSRAQVMMLETSGAEHDPTLGADGMHLYLAPDSPSPQHIVMATRQPAGDFAAPMTLTELSSSSGASDPSPTPDERIIVFASSGTLFYATRSASSGMFSNPIIISDLSTNAEEGDPHLSSDGCRLYFARDTGASVAADQGDWDLFVATVEP